MLVISLFATQCLFAVHDSVWWCRKTWLHFLVCAPSSCRTGDLNSRPPDLELGALTKWLASLLVWMSRQASLHSSLKYHIGVLHFDVEKWRRASESAGQVSLPVTCQAASVSQLPWRRASESARQVSLPVTCQAVRVTQPDRLTWSCDHASHVLRHHVGVNTVERPDPKGLSTF
jgi:hypothetical protein